MLRDFLAFVSDLYVGAEALVVGVLDDLADVDVLKRSAKVQCVIGFGVSGKPVLAIDLLAPSSELGEKVFVILFTDVGNGLAERLYDLEIVVVYPNATLKVALLAFDLLGSNVEHVAVQFVFLLLAGVENAVLGNFVGCENKGQAVADIVDIFRTHGDPAVLECGLRSINHVFQTFSLVVE